MQVISSYLMKRIAEVKTVGHTRFVEKAKLIEWLDDVGGGSLDGFLAHLGLEVGDSQYMGWCATEVEVEGETVVGRKEMTMTSFRFLVPINRPWAVYPTSDTSNPPVGAWPADANPCPKWAVAYADMPWAESATEITYSYDIYVGDVIVQHSSNTETGGGGGIPRNDYTSQNASAEQPYAGCEVKEWTCLFNFPGFSTTTECETFASALQTYASSPTSQNKQAVINTLANCLNP